MLEKLCVFTSRSAYRILTEIALPAHPTTFKKLWARRENQPRVLHLVWRCLNDALMTNECRAYALTGANSACPLCSNKAETISHILLHCSVVPDIWNDWRIKFKFTAGEDMSTIIDCWLNFEWEWCECLWYWTNLLRNVRKIIVNGSLRGTNSQLTRWRPWQ